MSLLVVMTHREPVDIEEKIEDDHGERAFADIPAVEMARPGGLAS